MNCFLFHNWAKWSEPRPGSCTRSIQGVEIDTKKAIIQICECRDCGLVKMREVV
jgi:hypothetical protein